MRHWAAPALPSFAPQRRLSEAGNASERWAAGQSRVETLALAALLCVAFALRATGIADAGFAHQDELFQYFEAAHRLSFGPGIIPWEYRYGMRNWLLPLFLSGPMRLGEALAPGSTLYLLLPRVALTALSLAIVVAAWKIGRRISLLHAGLAGAVAAFWPELVHLAPHALAEPVAVAFVLPAAALIGNDRPWAAASAGFLLGLGCVIRFQYLPAVVALTIVALLRHSKGWRALLIGAALAGVVSAGVDMAMGSVPFAWLFANVRENFLNARASAYGVAAPLAYIRVLTIDWSIWALPIVALAVVGGRRRPDMLIAALTNLAFHSCIAHKEYRFIFLTIVLLLVLAALGTADLTDWAKRRLHVRLAPFVLACWGLAAATLAATGRHATFDTPASPARLSFAELRLDPALCGIATSNIDFANGGGYTLLHQAVPMYVFGAGEATALARHASAYNRIVAPRGAALPSGFVPRTCRAGFGDYPAVCLSERPGPCVGSVPQNRINTVLARIDQ